MDARARLARTGRRPDRTRFRADTAELLVAAALLLAAAPSAEAGDHNMRVNEISPGEGFVELLDVPPTGATGPASGTTPTRTGRSRCCPDRETGVRAGRPACRWPVRPPCP